MKLLLLLALAGWSAANIHGIGRGTNKRYLRSLIQHNKKLFHDEATAEQTVEVMESSDAPVAKIRAINQIASTPIQNEELPKTVAEDNWKKTYQTAAKYVLSDETSAAEKAAMVEVMESDAPMETKAAEVDALEAEIESADQTTKVPEELDDGWAHKYASAWRKLRKLYYNYEEQPQSATANIANDEMPMVDPMVADDGWRHKLQRLYQYRYGKYDEIPARTVMELIASNDSPAVKSAAVDQLEQADQTEEIEVKGDDDSYGHFHKKALRYLLSHDTTAEEKAAMVSIAESDAPIQEKVEATEQLDEEVSMENPASRVPQKVDNEWWSKLVKVAKHLLGDEAEEMKAVGEVSSMAGEIMASDQATPEMKAEATAILEDQKSYYPKKIHLLRLLKSRFGHEETMVAPTEEDDETKAMGRIMQEAGAMLQSEQMTQKQMNLLYDVITSEMPPTTQEEVVRSIKFQSQASGQPAAMASDFLSKLAKKAARYVAKNPHKVARFLGSFFDEESENSVMHQIGLMARRFMHEPNKEQLMKIMEDPNFMKYFMEEVDTNKDGKVTTMEWEMAFNQILMPYWEEMGMEPIVPEVEWMTLDVNKNGFVDFMEEIMPTMFDMVEEPIFNALWSLYYHGFDYNMNGVIDNTHNPEMMSSKGHDNEYAYWEAAPETPEFAALPMAEPPNPATP